MLTSLDNSDVVDSETREIINNRKSLPYSSRIQNSCYDNINDINTVDGKFSFLIYLSPSENLSKPKLLHVLFSLRTAVNSH